MAEARGRGEGLPVGILVVLAIVIMMSATIFSITILVAYSMGASTGQYAVVDEFFAAFKPNVNLAILMLSLLVIIILVIYAIIKPMSKGAVLGGRGLGFGAAEIIGEHAGTIIRVIIVVAIVIIIWVIGLVVNTNIAQQTVVVNGTTISATEGLALMQENQNNVKLGISMAGLALVITIAMALIATLYNKIKETGFGFE